jgi:hypothetical protein
VITVKKKKTKKTKKPWCDYENSFELIGLLEGYQE